MKTRFLPILLAIALLTALTACESPAAPDDSGTGQSTTESGVLADTPADDTPEQSDESLGLFRTDATLAETVLVDENGVKICPLSVARWAIAVTLSMGI